MSRYVCAARLYFCRCIFKLRYEPNQQVRYSHARVGGARSVKSFVAAQVNPYLVGDGASLNRRVGERLFLFR